MSRTSILSVTWLIADTLGKIRMALPRAKRFGDNTAPKLQEIRKIVEYPD